MSDLDLDELRDELDDFAQPQKAGSHSPKEERIIAGFEEIQRFVTEHGHVPIHGENNDIFERLYAVRLDKIKSSPECVSLLATLDHQGLLSESVINPENDETLNDDELLAELSGLAGTSNISKLKHVRSQAEIRVAEEIANRTKCENFDSDFAHLFAQVEAELKNGIRRTRTFGINPSIDYGDFFIVNGQMVYVAEVGETIKAPNGENDARLRVIYSNGTESNLLKRSLQRALYKDEAGRRLTTNDAGPLFGDNIDDDDIESGTIYVLRSCSDHPFIAEHRELIHKIGVTGGDVRTRINNAANDATYLLAEVEVVATYKLAGIDRTKLESLFHKVFAAAQLDIVIQDRFGHPVRPREWFLVPLHIINEVVDRMRDGTIIKYKYNPNTANLEDI